MREIDFLHYIPGNSLWHKHDPRFKLMEMIFWTVSALMGSIPTLITTGMILTLIHGLAGSRIRIFRKPLCFWMIMSLAILAAGGLAEPQPPFIIFHWPTPFGIPGLVTGGLRSLRLLVVLMAGQLLTATTDPADLADAVRRSFFFPAQKLVRCSGHSHYTYPDQYPPTAEFSGHDSRCGIQPWAWRTKIHLPQGTLSQPSFNHRNSPPGRSDNRSSTRPVLHLQPNTHNSSCEIRRLAADQYEHFPCFRILDLLNTDFKDTD